MKLHLGCGKRYIPGFIHVDLANFKHINYKRNVKNLSCFKSNSVDLIYACQVLEYFDVDEIHVVLKEWRRVLKKNGTLRLSVPNFEKINLLYQNKKLKLVLSFSSKSKINHKRYQAGGLNQKNLFHLNPDKKSNHSTKGTKKDKPYTKQENMIYKHKIIIHFFILENLNFSTKSTKIDGRMI